MFQVCNSMYPRFSPWSHAIISLQEKVSHLYKEEFEDTKGVIRICISKKSRQHNGPKKKDKRTNNDIQNIHIKLKTEKHEPH